jgi:branched-chain amino acid transport system substrate-binding protein
MAKIIQKFHLAFVCLMVLLVCLSGCMEKPPIRIGLAAQLTGKQADLGIQLRNGVQLAVDEINASGGINGRNLELSVEDDLGTPQGAKDAQNKLIDKGVVAIIGHFTSAQTLAGYEVAHERGVLLFSATASTSLMTGIEDLFYRTVSSTDALGSGLASYIIEDRNINTIAIIYDEDNNSYSEPLVSSFTDTYRQSGGIITHVEKFSSSQDADYSVSVAKMKNSLADAVLIIASPYDTALIAQTIFLQDWAPALFTSSWAQGETLFETGGKTLEGMETIVGFDVNDQNPELDDFKQKYEQVFGKHPIFSAMEGYETMHMLAIALQKTNGSAENLGEELVSVQDHIGLNGPVRLDAYGDAVRNLAIQKVIDRTFVTIKKLEIAQ